MYQLQLIEDKSRLITRLVRVSDGYVLMQEVTTRNYRNMSGLKQNQKLK